MQLELEKRKKKLYQSVKKQTSSFNVSPLVPIEFKWRLNGLLSRHFRAELPLEVIYKIHHSPVSVGDGIVSIQMPAHCTLCKKSLYGSNSFGIL
jgi:hypothetical protein